jgi:hypothetical protein
MIHIPSFIKTDSGVQTLIAGHRRTYREQGGFASILSFFQNMESRQNAVRFFHRKRTTFPLKRPTV